MPGEDFAGCLLLDHNHCRAICDEIGERLREVLRREAPELPLYLRRLLDELAESERELAPSVAPSIGDTHFRGDTLVLKHAKRLNIPRPVTTNPVSKADDSLIEHLGHPKVYA
jgi:hypothetical protein